MHVFTQLRDELDLKVRVPESQPAPLPISMVENQLDERDGTPIMKRADSAASSTAAAAPTTSCGPKDNSGICQKPVDSTSTSTIPIVLGVVLPVTVALIIFIFLQRRHVRRLKSEDADDRTKSLDFGMDDVPHQKGKKGKGGKNNKPVPEITIAETKNAIKRESGLSMDMDTGSPYILPPDLQKSRESLHSLSRNMDVGDHKYRLSTFVPHDGTGSYPGSVRRFPQDDAASITHSTRHDFGDAEVKHNLLGYAQHVSLSSNHTKQNSVTSHNSTLMSHAPSTRQEQTGPLKPLSLGYDIGGSGQGRDSLESAVNRAGHASVRVSSRAGGSSPADGQNQTTSPETITEDAESLPRGYKAANQPMERLGGRGPILRQVEVDDYTTAERNPTRGEGNASLSQSPKKDLHGAKAPRLPEINVSEVQKFGEDLGFDVSRLSTGLYPLPPDDPADNPEQRANRIRSFYKEYFEDSKTAPVHKKVEYYEDGDYFDQDDSMADIPMPGPPPFADPIPRRTMTPPFPGGARQQYGQPSRMGTHGGNVTPSGNSPRSYSDSSGWTQNSRAPPPVMQKPPTPPPLHMLPTPHMLKSDSYVPIDFAPPTTYRERLAGVPDSPKGGVRPFSPPSRPAPLSLASSFDDLTMIPSPHALVNSDAMSGLDFAAPPRFKTGSAASDTGSVRSNRSGMGAAQLNAIRNGAHRVSRIPRDVGGTKDELANSLKPQWEMRK